MKLHTEKLGTGSPVLILHGLFGSGDNWRPHAQTLARNHSVFLLDLRNHGKSPHVSGMSMTEMAADVYDTMQELGIDRCGIIGHSLGGKVAMEAALGRPDCFSGIVVVDIAPKQYPVRHREIIAGMRAVQAAASASRRDADTVLVEHVPDKRVRAFLLKSYMSTDGGGEWRINVDAIEHEYEHIRGDLSAKAKSSRYSGPSLFVAGAQSDYLSRADSSNIAALFPKARIEVVDNAGHWLHAEQPEKLAELLEGFHDAWN